MFYKIKQMRKVFLSYFLIIFIVVLIFSLYFLLNKKQNEKIKTKPFIVCTTSIIGQTVQEIINDYAEVKILMGPGIDPHLYKPCPNDIYILNSADLIFYHGLHLEGKMGEIFNNLGDNGKNVFSVTKNIKKKDLRQVGNGEIFDPHVWFDPNIWKIVVTSISECLKNLIPEKSKIIDENSKKFIKKIDILDSYIKNKCLKIPQKKRILISAHDAFSYFGRCYGFEIIGVQGISTDAEIRIEDIERVAKVIIENDVKTIFIEQTVSENYINGIKNIVEKKGINLKIGKKLYSDALGECGSNAETYLLMIKKNVDTIFEGLI
jgi:manganese/zinc/iron transport system substrate-binding protein